MDIRTCSVLIVDPNQERSKLLGHAIERHCGKVVETVSNISSAKQVVTRENLDGNQIPLVVVSLLSGFGDFGDVNLVRSFVEGGVGVNFQTAVVAFGKKVLPIGFRDESVTTVRVSNDNEYESSLLEVAINHLGKYSCLPIKLDSSIKHANLFSHFLKRFFGWSNEDAYADYWNSILPDDIASHHEYWPTKIRALNEIIRSYFPTCVSASLQPLQQGFSGAIVFGCSMVLESTDGIQQEKFAVFKVCVSSSTWKLQHEIACHTEIKESLTVEDGLEAHRLDLFEVQNTANEYGKYLCGFGGYFAIATQFLRENLGNFIDFESAYQTAKTVPEKIIKKTLKALKNAWFDAAKIVEIDRLWSKAPFPEDIPPSYPPYQLTDTSRFRILRSLTELHDYGAQLLGGDFAVATKVIESLLISDVALPESLVKPVEVLLSKSHGDLNRNNILFWREKDHVIFIDFSTFQSHGHLCQDFATLETQILFGLMDRESSTNSRAFDLDLDRFNYWRNGISSVFRPEFPNGNIESVPEVEKAVKLCSIVRKEAKRIFDKHDFSDNQFWLQYATALLFHTVRTIYFSDVSPLKKIAAIASIPVLVGQLDEQKGK